MLQPRYFLYFLYYAKCISVYLNVKLMISGEFLEKQQNRAIIFLIVMLNGEVPVIAMSVSYDKLWKLLIDKKMNRTELKDSSGISFNVLAKMGKNESVSMESLMKICATLNCNVGNIMDFLPESEELQK